MRRKEPKLGGHFSRQTWRQRGMPARYIPELCLSNLGIYYMSVVHTRLRKLKKVLDFIRVTEIPKKHILKRWTKDAMDILPPHLAQYQKDHAQQNPFSYRHFNMHMHPVELVRMGVCSVKAYDHLISLFKNVLLK